MAAGADMLVTAGGVQSNHCRQMAAVAARHGLACELVLARTRGPCVRVGRGADRQARRAAAAARAGKVLDGYVGPGYGLPTQGRREAVDLCGRPAGLVLDPVYYGTPAFSPMRMPCRRMRCSTAPSSPFGRTPTASFWRALMLPSSQTSACGERCRRSLPGTRCDARRSAAARRPSPDRRVCLRGPGPRRKAEAPRPRQPGNRRIPHLRRLRSGHGCRLLRSRLGQRQRRDRAWQVSPQHARANPGRGPRPLAISHLHQGRGLGRALFRDCTKRVLHAADTIGIRGILVHAISDDARAFYLALGFGLWALGFEPSPLDPMTLMLTLADARGALRRSSA